MRCIPYKSEKGEYSSHIFWRNENGDFYSFNDQPAYRDNNGFFYWYKGGILHRDYGKPACYRSNNKRLGFYEEGRELIETASKIHRDYENR